MEKMYPEDADLDIELEQVKKKRRIGSPEKDTAPQICSAKDIDTGTCSINDQDLNESVEQNQKIYVEVATCSKELVEAKADTPLEKKQGTPLEQKQDIDMKVELEQVEKMKTESSEMDTDLQICSAKDNDTGNCSINDQDLNESVEQNQKIYVEVATCSQELVEVKADTTPLEQKQDIDVKVELEQVEKMRTESSETDTDPQMCSAKDNDTGNCPINGQDLNESVGEKQKIDAKVATCSKELVEAKADMLPVEQKQDINLKVASSSQELIDVETNTPTAEEEKSEVSEGTNLTGGSKRKLLILDLNGVLADVVTCVPDEYQADFVIGINKVFKRPYHTDFLQFCFERFDVGVWSSRTKKNVDMLIDLLLGDSKSKLLFCWDQSHCTATGFTTRENRNKPLYLKEIKKLWDIHDPDLPWERGYYGESNTLLIDDSPYKALKNPPYTAIFPDTYHYCDVKDNALGVGGDLRVYLERLSGAADVQQYVQQNPYGQNPITDSHPSWRFYAKVIGIELDFGDTRNEDKEIAEHPKSKYMSRHDIVLRENSEQLSNWDRLTRGRKEEIDLRVAIQKCEGSSNFPNMGKATSIACGHSHPNESYKRYGQYTSRGPVHPLSRVDPRSRHTAHGRDRIPHSQQIAPRSFGRPPAIRSRRKLLILEMNGVLADILPRSKYYKPDAVIGGRAVLRRPFSDEFLEFCFERFYVGFWLTTCRSNAKHNLEFLLGGKVQDLFFSWNTDQCFTTAFATKNKPNKKIVVKELRKLWDKSEPFLPWHRGEFDETNTLLVDVYPHAALLNPPSTAIFPFKYLSSNGEDNLLEPGGEFQRYLERIAEAENVQEYVQNNPFRGQQPITEKHPHWDYYREVIEKTEAYFEEEQNKWYNN